MQVREAEEEESVVLEQLVAGARCPAVGLVVLFKEALDSRGLPVEKRLEGLKVSDEAGRGWNDCDAREAS